MLSRPRPPDSLVDGAAADPAFIPAPEVWEWAKASFIVEDAPLLNPVHSHLAYAEIGVLWTNVPNSRHGRPIVGQAEFKPPGGSMGKWARARAECQLIGWFGTASLDFLITFDAQYAASCSDRAFCAVVEHELGHCGQAKDEFGAPKFNPKTGEPVFAMRGHDIEEFTFIVARYGADAAGVQAMIEAAKNAPEADDTMIGIACGTCG